MQKRKEKMINGERELLTVVVRVGKDDNFRRIKIAYIFDEYGESPTVYSVEEIF